MINRLNGTKEQQNTVDDRLNATNHIQSRSLPLDIARGVAISGVVVSHTLGGLLSVELVSHEGFLMQVNEALYLLRMPALVFLMGMFLPLGVKKRGSHRYAGERVVELMYLYLLWYLILAGFDLALVQFKNHPVSIIDTLQIWVPKNHLWFLPMLALLTSCVAYMQPWQSTLRRTFAVTAALFVTLMMWQRNFDIVGLTGLSLLIFAVLGATIGLKSMSIWLQGHTRIWLAILLFSGFMLAVASRLGAVPATLGVNGVPLGTGILSLVSALFGVVALLATSRFLSTWSGLAYFLGRLGSNTMAIFVMHVVFSAAVRELLLALDVSNLTMHLLFGISAGIFAPLIVLWASKLLRVHGLFELPNFLRSYFRRTSF